MLYAVKRIKKKISSESEGRLVVKESCALASLMSCPFMIRYFGCWIDDGHLHIQTEYCDKGSMDCFVLNSNVRNSDLLIPDDRYLNIDINRNNEDDDDIQVNHDNDNDINHENENNDNNNHNDDKDDNRIMKRSVDEIFTEKSNNTNYNEKQLFSVYENSQNDSLFDSQKDEMENNDEKENKEFQENTLEYNNDVNNHYSNNNNDDNDDELFIKEDNDNDNQNMDINIDGIDISNVIKKNEFYSDIDKENNENNSKNDNRILSICENDAQLGYSDAIFSAEEDSRNSDTYSCFSESNSNNYYDLKYNKNEEFQNENEIENPNYENQILRNNKNNKETVNQEKRITIKINNNTLKDKYNVKNDIEIVTEKDIRGKEGNHSCEDDADRGDVIEVEIERTREGEGGREREGVSGRDGEQEEENRNADSEMSSGVVSEGLVWEILHSMGSALQYMHSRGDAVCGVVCVV
jgi:hypothetical protein